MKHFSFLILLFALISCGGSHPHKKASFDLDANNAIDVDARELQKTFYANTKRVDSMYTGKTLRISGTVAFSSGASNDVYVALVASDFNQVIYCWLENPQDSSFFKKGQPAKLVGTWEIQHGTYIPQLFDCVKSDK